MHDEPEPGAGCQSHQHTRVTHGGFIAQGIDLQVQHGVGCHGPSRLDEERVTAERGIQRREASGAATRRDTQPRRGVGVAFGSRQ